MSSTPAIIPRPCPRPRRGVSIIYVAVTMVVLLGFCSLAVDLGRVQVAKTELECACDAASRAGADNISNGVTAVQNAAYNIALANTADGSPVTIDSINSVVFLNWPSTTPLTGTARNSANAIQVTASRQVPLVFAQAIGMPTATVHATSTTQFSSNISSIYVPATSDIWLSGEPNGTQGGTSTYGYDYAGTVGQSGGPGGNPYASPVKVAIAVTPGAVITVTNVTGLAYYNQTHSPEWNADGDQAHIYDDEESGGASEHGMSDATMGLCALNAVFLGSGLPDNGTPPPPLDFSTIASQNYTVIHPQLQQVFFVGTGQTTTGVQQQIIVPAGATRMYLGVMDGYQWYNDEGGFNATVSQTSVTVVK